MRLSFLFVVTLLLLLTGCRSQDGDLKGPATVPSGGQDDRESLPYLLPAGPENDIPTQASIASLAASPGAFVGKRLQVEGIFSSSTNLLCSDQRFGSPASWALKNGQEQIAAGGLDSLAGALPDGQITLVVEGYWRSWPIPANCRQEGEPAELHFLEAVRVISPNPIALAPGNALAAGSLPATEQPVVIPTATTGLAFEPPVQVTPDPGSALPTQAVPNLDGYPPPIDTPAAGDGGYPGPALTPLPGDQTPGTPAAETPVERDLLTPGSLETGTVGPGISERWPIVITATQAISLQIMPEAGLEIIATVLDRNGQVLTANPSTAAGQVVRLTAVNLPEGGEYTLLVTTLGAGAGAYAVLLTDQDSYNFQFQDNLADGVAKSGELLPESDHMFFFSGAAGDVVDLSARPLGGADLFLRLFDPAGSMLLSFHDEVPAGQGEQITAYTLPATGLFTLIIGELDFAGGQYTVILDRG